MRELIGLYRGKRIDNDEWVEGNLLAPNYICDDWCISPPLELLALPIDPDTVGECTGLRDKNGKLIFEGDIFHSVDSWIEATGLVYYDEGGWCVNNDFLQAFMWNGKVRGEIIGTIHDNPELLKGGEGDADV